MSVWLVMHYLNLGKIQLTFHQVSLKQLIKCRKHTFRGKCWWHLLNVQFIETFFPLFRIRQNVSFVEAVDDRLQCDQIWQNFATFRDLFIVWQHFEPTLAKNYVLEQILIVVNGQRLKNILGIWAHWQSLRHGRQLEQMESFWAEHKSKIYEWNQMVTFSSSTSSASKLYKWTFSKSVFGRCYETFFWEKI